MSDKERTAIVQIGCGFSRKPLHKNDIEALSIIDISRGNQACQEYKRLCCPEHLSLELWSTGEVAWTPLSDAQGTTLAELNARHMKYTLEETKVCAAPHAIRLIPGHTPFSECWNTIELARSLSVTKLVVVTSAFYLSLYQHLWEAVARREGVYTILVSAGHYPGAVSPMTWQSYQSLGAQVSVSVAASSRIGHWAIMHLAELSTKSRITKGYQLTGHTSHR